jgi:RHS repeat-associated protein
MLQQNEWDEEFGLDLHDFDARLYDASIGRFWGVDVYAEKQYPLSPYHYAANNPIMMQDPNGELFFAAAILIGKLILKKVTATKIAAGFMAKFAKSKAIKVSVSGISNMVANQKQIGKALKKDGLKGIGMALGYGLAGSLGGAVGLHGTSLDAFVAGGALNTMFEMHTGQMTADGVNPLGRMAGSFLTGGFSALAGKNFSKSMETGSDWALKKHMGDALNLPAKPGIFSQEMLGKYAMSATENFGGILNKNDGHVNWKQFAMAWGGGFAMSMGTYSLQRGLDMFTPRAFRNNSAKFTITSIVSPLVSNALGATALNAVNYYTSEGKWPKNIKSLSKDWIKTFYKIDFYTGSSFLGFSLSNNGLARVFR